MKRIVFMGTPDFSVPILDALVEHGYNVVLVVTQPDRPKGRKKVLTPPPVKTKANEHNIPVFQPRKIREEYKKVLSYAPDLIITAAYGQILPSSLLETPPFGCINVHASLLPELRGGAPIHYALIEGKTETGVTIMYMVDRLDAGDILTQRKLSIAFDDNVGTLHDKLSKLGTTLLMDTLPQLFDGDIQPKEQDDDIATFARNIKREEEKLQFSRTNEEVYNHIRGLNPWPVAFTTFQDKQMKVWWAQPVDAVYTADPGEVVDIDKESFTVVCGNQKGIQISEVQPAGKKRMPVSEFLLGAGSSINIGTKLGD
ncbi:MAG TPA: methionyl-tRNA formyltransferase [Virgibacillus sp.]|nr:methionyl-tRNA formyltransferase [Virgibacillus sp.]